MGKPFLIIKSMTSSMRAKYILESQGFLIKMDKISSSRNYEGCSYRLSILSGNIDMAKKVLVSSGINAEAHYGGETR